ncbi:MAG TPA: penicillin acylase family protein [Candidatus Limnocylindria bacterium]|nr:penicillin acylase family protein [Candidatus Limnocylindria bacterium]
MRTLRLIMVLAAVLGIRADARAAAVTVREPAFDLPHIYADTDLELARENGREIAKDRLVQMILLARVGRGTLSQAFGALQPATLQDDIEARRTAYTSSELDSMFQKWPQRERDLTLAYCAGVNDTIEAIYTGALPKPLEVDVLQNVLGLSDDLFGNKTNISDQPDPYYIPPGGSSPGHPYDGQHPTAGFQFTPEMVVSIAILEVRNFGLGGFDEASRLAELQALIAKHGSVAGTQIWDDLNFLNDPLAPVTVPDPATPGYGGPLARTSSPTMLANVAGRFPRRDWAAGMQALADDQARRAAFAASLGAWPMMGSYAWVIAGNKSATEWPWLGGFPQTGIQTPSLMHFVENRSGEGASNRIRGIGMEFAGAGPVVLIGQTDTVAYTTTTAQLRVVDQFFETIVNEDADALRYDDEGSPAPLVGRTEIFRGGLLPDTVRVFYRTHERGGNGGSRPVIDFVGDVEGTANGGGATTLVDSGPFDASLVGGYVALVGGTGAGQIRQIAAVDATTLTVGSPWTTPPDATSVYVAVAAGNAITAVTIDSSVWQEETTTGLGFILLQRAEDVLDVRAATRIMPSTHNFLAADNQPFNGIGTQNGNGNITYHSSGFSRRRQGGLDPRLPMDGGGANPLVVATGTVASATPNGLSAAGTPFNGLDLSPEAINFRYHNPTQQGSDYIVRIVSGAGAWQTRRIASNTASDLTIEYPWGVEPAPGDLFEVSEIVAMPEAMNPSEGYMANWNNKAATADEGENFGRQFRHIFILERLAAENAWDRAKQRQLNKDLAGLEGRGAYGRFLLPRVDEAVDAVGNGGEPSVDAVLAQLLAHQGPPFFGRRFIDPVLDTVSKGEMVFLNSLVNRLARDIYGDELAGAVSVPTGSRALNLVQHAIDSKAGDVPGSYAQAFEGDYFAFQDHYLCYKAKPTRKTPKFQPQSGIALADGIEAGTAKVVRPKALCLPANKNEEGVRYPDTHLVAYVLKSDVAHVPQSGVTVTDQFGTLSLDTKKASRLLVPAGMALGAPATVPTDAVDHYKCYKAKVTQGTPKFAGAQAAVVDRFENRLYDVKKVKELCLAADKNGEGVHHPGSAILCYKAKAASGEPPHARVLGQIQTADQFGALRLDTKTDDQLCVPATLGASGLDGWETTVRDSLKALAPGGIPGDTTRAPCVLGSPVPPCSRYRHPLAALFPSLEFEPTPEGNRGTYEQIVEVAPTVNGEFMFPLGQSGHIEGTIAGVTFISPHVDDMQPVWRDWRFLPMLHVGADLETAGTADTDGDGVFDGFERWYFGDLSRDETDDGDGDGATLGDEFAAGSDPTDADTDDDGAADGADGAPQNRLVP